MTHDGLMYVSICTGDNPWYVVGGAMQEVIVPVLGGVISSRFPAGRRLIKMLV